MALCAEESSRLLSIERKELRERENLKWRCTPYTEDTEIIKTMQNLKISLGGADF